MDYARVLKLAGSFALLSSIVVLTSAISFAQGHEKATKAPAAAEAEDKEPDKLQAGVAASYGSFRGQTSVDANAEPEAAGGTETPVSASISRSGADDCKVNFMNSSAENKYSARFNIIGTRKSGAQAFSRHMSVTLGPGERSSRNVACPKDVNMKVVLKSGRKL